MRLTGRLKDVRLTLSLLLKTEVCKIPMTVVLMRSHKSSSCYGHPTSLFYVSLSEGREVIILPLQKLTQKSVKSSLRFYFCRRLILKGTFYIYTCTCTITFNIVCFDSLLLNVCLDSM